MKKDVIYIDIEDDITGIIGKVKAASSKIVALVPPKRIGVLQSAVNLKLLQKGAQSGGKRIVLITSDHSLMTLAAGLKMPVAKNLQSRPEIPELDVPQSFDEEIINGEELPVGELAAAGGEAGELASATATPPPSASAADQISSQVDLRNLNQAKAPTQASGKPKKGIAVPNFAMFRKRFFLIGGGAILLILLLYWMFAIAPHATVTISAKTTAINIDQTLGLDPSLQQSKVAELKFKTTPRQIKKSVSADFTATGTKDVGTKASGTVTVTNSFDSDSKTLPAATVFVSASGLRFVSTAAVTVPGAKVSGGSIKPGTVEAQLQASDIGPEYNIAAQAYSISGYDSLSGSGAAMSGGDKQTVTVVSQTDIDKAKGQLAEQNANSIKSDLKKQFGRDLIVIDESFTSEQGNPSVTPALGEQAKQAKLTVETTYALLGLARDDVGSLLNEALKSALDTKQNQSIFSNGINTIKFALFQKFDGGTYAVRLSTTGYIGTKIDADDLSKQLAGKRYGEIQAIVNQIPNVSHVDIRFSPFWVNGAPSDPKKVDIKFTISNDK